MRDSMGVSPDTMRVRPALKRFNSQNAEPRRQLNFNQFSMSYYKHLYSIDTV